MRPVFVGADEPNQIHISLGRHPVSITYYVSMTLLCYTNYLDVFTLICLYSFSILKIAIVCLVHRKRKSFPINFHAISFGVGVTIPFLVNSIS